MATLVHEATGRQVLLVGEHTIGRSSACRLTLKDGRASGHHALLRWTGEGWELLDLGSRNGTWVGGQKLASGQRQVVSAGDVVAFGKDTPESRWALEDDSAPALAACLPGGGWVVADDGLLSLPSATKPLAMVYTGEDGQWVLELDGVVTDLEPPEAEVSVGGVRWTICLPEPVTSTRAVAAVEGFAGLSFSFAVSQDEENVEIQVSGTKPPIRIKHRAQHYLLLTLARAYIEDTADPELSPSERGWRYADDIARALRIPELQFNVTIYRARQHLQKAGVPEPRKILERRRGSGQIRIGSHNVTVTAL